MYNHYILRQLIINRNEEENLGDPNYKKSRSWQFATIKNLVHFNHHFATTMQLLSKPTTHATMIFVIICGHVVASIYQYMCDQMMGPTNYQLNMQFHDTTTKVLGQNVYEILSYFVHFLLFVHSCIITKLHGDNNHNFLTTMDNISCQLSQISLHGTHGISINFQHKYSFISMH